MKCHWTHDEKGKKHFIPGCQGTMHSLDIDDCCCVTNTFFQFENQLFNKMLVERNEKIQELEIEIVRLNAIIETHGHSKPNPSLPRKKTNNQGFN